MTTRMIGMPGLVAGMLACAAAAAEAPAWHHFSVQSGTPGLAGDEVQVIKPAAGGGVWIGTLNGLSRGSGGAFATVAGADGKPMTMAVWDLLELPSGEVLVGHEGGVTALPGAAGGKGLAEGTTAPLVPFDGGIRAIVKRAGVGRVVARGRDGTWSDVAALKGVRAEDMTLLADGSLWIMSDGDGVHEQPADAAAAPRHHLQGMNVTSVYQDRRQRVWCALWGGGLMVREGSAWERHLTGEKAAILTVAETPDGAIWAASSASGLWRHDGRGWNNLLAEEGSVNLLAVTADGRVWVSGQQTGGLRFWDGRAWTTAIAGPLPVRCLLEAPDGSLWAGGVLDGVHVYR